MDGQGRYVPFGGKGQGPGGQCVCPGCGYTIEHTFDEPCFQRRCPNCGMYLARR